MACHSVPARDGELIQIVNAAFADSVRRSGKWLACKPGCSQCCVGVFSINQLDAARLRQGLDDLELKDPALAGRIRQRARATVARLSPDYPGNAKTGVLDETESPEASKRWDDFANDVPCPVLNPETGVCEMYESRPLLCRTFGPPVQSDENEDDLIVCDLCFDGASDEEVEACQMRPDPGNLEPVLLEEYEKSTGAKGETIIAFAIGRS